ncbi:tetratricopeptide repeat protein 21 like protein [Ditylenchus destructor]|uniref:Tetratricopeptide repeat protein 21 like protein n=1 Tax=Ditylenchus destructor TaxID=166010 RepID=A0AAD4NKT7_9BILA|nr:tetratricopeptide repeat protein 21 like protein [Ditylenchus destructor]
MEETSSICYWIRENYHGSALVKIEEQLLRNPGNGHLLLLKAFCLSYTDKESVKDVEKSIQLMSGNTGADSGFYSAALLWMLNGSYDRSRPLVARIATPSTTTSSYLTLRGWLEILSGRDVKTALDMFEKAILIDQQNAAEMKGVLETMTASNPSFLPGYIELAKAAGMTRNWDEINELIQKIALVQFFLNEELDFTATRFAE